MPRLRVLDIGRLGITAKALNAERPRLRRARESTARHTMIGMAVIAQARRLSLAAISFKVFFLVHEICRHIDGSRDTL